nr:510_t:CDS:2 [Entrophospora candida]
MVEVFARHMPIGTVKAGWNVEFRNITQDIPLGIFTILRLVNNDISTINEFKNDDENMNIVIDITLPFGKNISKIFCAIHDYLDDCNLNCNNTNNNFYTYIEIPTCIFKKKNSIYISITTTIDANDTVNYIIVDFKSPGGKSSSFIPKTNYSYDINFKKKIIKKLIRNWKSYLGLFIEYDKTILWELDGLYTTQLSENLDNQTITMNFSPRNPNTEIITEIK